MWRCGVCAVDHGGVPIPRWRRASAMTNTAIPLDQIAAECHRQPIFCGDERGRLSRRQSAPPVDPRHRQAGSPRPSNGPRQILALGASNVMYLRRNPSQFVELQLAFQNPPRYRAVQAHRKLERFRWRRTPGCTASCSYVSPRATILTSRSGHRDPAPRRGADARWRTPRSSPSRQTPLVKGTQRSGSRPTTGARRRR